MAETNEDSLWQEIDPQSWKSTPSLSGKPATEIDVKEGRAVFYVKDALEIGIEAIEMKLPACAVHIDVETGEKTPCILIQAEKVNDKILVGFRPIEGGNGVGTLPEFTILEGPNELFKISANKSVLTTPEAAPPTS